MVCGGPGDFRDARARLVDDGGGGENTGRQRDSACWWVPSRYHSAGIFQHACLLDSPSHLAGTCLRLRRLLHPAKKKRVGNYVSEARDSNTRIRCVRRLQYRIQMSVYCREEKYHVL